MVLRFTRPGIMLRIKGPYSAPRLVLKGSCMFLLIQKIPKFVLLRKLRVKVLRYPMTFFLIKYLE